MDYADADFRKGNGLQYDEAKHEEPGHFHYLLDLFWSVFSPVGVGMGPHPLSFLEIEAFERRLLYSLTTYEAMGLRRISLAYCRVYSDKNGGKTDTANIDGKNVPQPKGLKSVVKMNDAAGIKALFSRQGVKKRNKP